MFFKLAQKFDKYSWSTFVKKMLKRPFKISQSDHNEDLPLLNTTAFASF